VRRHSVVAVMAALVLTVGILGPDLASSAPKGDARAEREKVRAEQAAVAAKLDTTKASKAEIDEALQVINQNLATQEAALARVQAEVAQAKQDIADAEAAIERLKGEIDTLKKLVRQRAVNAYVSPPGDDVLTVLDTNDFVTASSRKFYIELRSQDDADVADRLDGALAEIDHQREKAEAARKVAEKKEAEQAERTEAVRTAEAQQQKLAASLQDTIDSQIARSIELQKTDRELSKKIAEEAAAAAARLAAARAAREEAAAAAAAAAASAPQVVQEPSGGGEIAPLAPSGPSGPAGSGTGGIPLCTARGITVNCAISGQLGAMIDKAAADGVSLSGSGYRDPSRQIELRRQHCGSSYYAIYQMPASSCRPPTARPGTSQHEIGLAIDFSNCSTRGTACYQWLAGNAAGFGFYNLPSEAWHWSTTGS
jgi:peptidoglycan hydrolase CwlO-like protein